MKLRLPKSLMLGISAITIIGTAGADTTDSLPFYSVIDDIVAPVKGEIVGCNDVEDEAKFVAKDGEGTFKYTGEGSICASIYAREGEFQIGDASQTTEVTIEASAPDPSLGAGVYGYGVSVGGKNAVIRLNNATVTSGSGSTIVGGQNGNGALIIENGSTYNAGGSEVFVIGDSDYSCATTKTEDSTTTPTADNWSEQMYKGSYSPAKNLSDAEFGRGDVTVSGGSKLFTPRSFYMSEGSLSVDNSEVRIGNSTNGLKALMGLAENSTSEINVTNGGKLEIQADQIQTNNADNTKTVITVDGAGSNLTIGKANTAWFGANGDEVISNTSASLKITGGAIANFDKTNVSFGSKNAENKSVKVDVTIGASSKMDVGGYLYLRKGAVLENAGTLSIDEAASLYAEGTAAIINSGTIDGYTQLSGNNTFTAMDGSEMGMVDVYGSSTLTIAGLVTMHEELWIGTEGSVVFTLGSSLDMTGHRIYGTMNFILDASAEGVTDLDSLVLTSELFTNYDESESKFSDDTVITVKLAGGNTETTTIGALQVIPEPATATLSLMALCALAARRRRAVR